VRSSGHKPHASAITSRQHANNTQGCVRSSGDPLLPSPPAEKATARQQQAGESVGQLAIAVAKAKRADHESQHARCNNLAGNLGDELTTATCQGEKTTASRYKTRQSRTHNRRRHCRN
jgi:hypothetical protein